MSGSYTERVPRGGDGVQPGSKVALRVGDLTKTFGGTLALDHVSLEIADGEVHALLGQNGCGKSTLVKALAGYHQPDPGYVAEMDSKPFRLGDASAAQAAGLRFVHQDLGLVLSLDAVENIALAHGYETRRGAPIRWSPQRARAREALGALGYDFDVTKPLSELSVSERAGVAIARAVRGWEQEARILVLDEVTASLPGPEVEQLFRVVRRLRDNGVAVIYVTHRLGEVLALADRVTVLRDGRNVTTVPTEGLTEKRLVELILGRELLLDSQKRPVAQSGSSALEVSGISGRWSQDLSFAVRHGEVVGFAGVTGSGREEVAGLIFGAGERTSGAVAVEGKALPANRPDAAVRHGVALVPAERATQATLGGMTIGENITLADVGSFWVRGWLKLRDERLEVAKWIDRFGIEPPSGAAEISTLSGGNQQKVMFARWARRNPKIMLLDEPTQGVDVGAKGEIHRFIDELAAAGAAVVVCSSDTDELERLCQRVIVLHEGRAVAELEGADLTAARIDDFTYSGARAAA